jgi:hypothetical protein
VSDGEMDAAALAVEREAYLQLFDHVATPALQRSLGLSAETCGPALVLRSTAIDNLLFNRTLGIADAAGDGVELAESIVARYRAQHITRYAVQLPAAAATSPLAMRLRALGLAPREVVRGFVHDAARSRRLPRDARAIERVDAGGATELAALLCGTHGVPNTAHAWLRRAVGHEGFHAYLARNAAGHARAGALFFASEDTGCTVLATNLQDAAADDRATALLARATAEILDLGCRSVSGGAALVVARLSPPVLSRAGFREGATWHDWMPSSSAARD